MPTNREHKRFCENDGWELIKETHHLYYTKVMPNGEIKRTKVSRGSGELNGHLWKKILNRELQVSLEYFNDHI
jgi:hypothetical protein